MQRVVIGLIVSLSVALAQPGRETVAQLMASPDAAHVAWGARIAANYDRKEFAAELLKLATSSDWRLRMVAIDSLVELNVDVPEEILFQMVDDDFGAALIFISRRPNEYERLIKDLLIRKLQDFDWLALNSILLSWPSSGFTASLLREWTIAATVTVINPGDQPTFSLRPRGGYCGDGFGFDRPGFPPLTRYYVYENSHLGDVLLATGPHPVGYRKQSYAGRCGSSVDRDEYRKDYLMHLADALRSTQASNTLIMWTGETAFQTAANELQLKIRQIVTNLKSRLVERKLLTPEEAATANPKLDVKVIDQRSQPLPALPEVRWTLQGV